MTTGAVFMFGFGVVWLLLGLFNGRPSPAWMKAALVAAGVGLGAVILTLGMRASHLPSPASLSPEQVAMNREIGKHFYLIFGLEMAAIFVAVLALNLLHHPDFILCGIALIVGVHFVPLAALFHRPIYYWTGFLGCAIGLLGFFIADSLLRQKVVGLSFGLLLWVTAGWIAILGLRATAQAVQQLPPM